MGWLFLATVPTQVAASSTPPTAPTRPAARGDDARTARRLPPERRARRVSMGHRGNHLRALRVWSRVARDGDRLRARVVGLLRSRRALRGDATRLARRSRAPRGAGMGARGGRHARYVRADLRVVAGACAGRSRLAPARWR